MLMALAEAPWLVGPPAAAEGAKSRKRGGEGTIGRSPIHT